MSAYELTEHMEHLWDIAAQVRTSALIVLYGACMAWFLNAFSDRGPGLGRAAGGVYSSILFVCFFVPYEMTATEAYLAAGAGAFLTYLILEHGRPLMNLFACLTFEAIRRIVSTIGSSVYILVSAQLVWPLWTDPEAQYLMFAAVCALQVLSEGAGAYLALRMIVRFFPDPAGTLRTGEFGLLAAPTAAAIVATQVLHELRQILDYGQYSVEVETQALILALVLLASLVAIIVMFGRVRAEQSSETDRQLLEGQIESMRGYIAQMERNDERMARLRHDAANHLETIAALQEKGTLADAHRYARRTYDDMVSVQSAIRTGNPVSDVILDEQQQIAKQRGIRYDTHFRFPSGLGIDAFDLGVILHNAGRNAIEGAAGSEEPWVCVRSTVHNHNVLIEVSNSCPAQVVLHPQTGLPVSTRQGEHGNGLRNIASAAAKYSGSVRAEAGLNTFTLLVLLSIHN